MLVVHEDIVAHHGDCIGADAQFHDMVRIRGGSRIVIHPPIDEEHRAFCVGANLCLEPLKHMQRNKQIVACSCMLIATPFDMVEQDRGGTWKTIGFARKARIQILIVWPNGTIQREPGDPQRTLFV